MATPKVTATVVGPGPDYIGGSADVNSRRLVVTVEVGDTLTTNTDHFHLVSHTTSYNGKWHEPYLWPLHWEVIGRYISLEEAEHAVKRLTAFRKYVQRLPFPPRTLGDYVSALLSFLKVGTLEYVHYPDSHSSPDVRREDAGVAYVAYQVEAAYEQLRQLNSAHSSDK